MSSPLSRRTFLGHTLTAGAVAGLADLGFLKALPPLSAADTKITPKVARFHPDIEPLVRLIEDTPRKDLLEKIAAEVLKGTSYQQLLTAVFLAGVRGIQPRPVGFKFHAVLVINSAHLAAQAAEDRDRWLPLFWAADNFKASQAKNAEEGDWHMPAVAEGKLPPAHKAKERFVEAMDAWDEEGVDRAVVSLVRSAGAAEVYELFWRYGARDFRDIGHKAIYAANSYRTLQAIGWRHAEPVVRSLAYAMLEHRERGNPARHDYDADRPGRVNLKRVKEMASLKRGGKHSAEAGKDLLSALRTATPAEASAKVEELLKKGAHPDSVWDGVFLRCGELLMQQPGIGGLHTMTTANALHFAYQVSGEDETRRLLLLQAAAFVPMFRDFMRGRGKLPDLRLDALEKSEPKAGGAGAVEEIFADVGKDTTRAARKTLALLGADPKAVAPLMAEARRLIFAKGRDAHDYKFSSAALEDYFHVAPAWRARYAAASVFWLKGSGAEDNDLIRRTRAALAKG
jgi:hypothetical protein